MTPVDRLWVNSPFKALAHGRQNRYNELTAGERKKYIKYLYMFEGSRTQQGSKLRPGYASLKKTLDRRIKETLELPQNQPISRDDQNEESLQKSMKALSKVDSLQAENNKPEYESDLAEDEYAPSSSAGGAGNKDRQNKKQDKGSRVRRWWYDEAQRTELQELYQKKLPNEREADDWLREVIGRESGL